MAQFSSKHGIVPIFDSSDSLEAKKNGSNMKIQHTSLTDGATRFPKLEECAHFHYDFVELGQLQLQLCEEDQENYHHQEYEQGEYQFMLRVMSKDKTWNIRRSYENFRMLDKQLHKCIFDRRFSHLPELESQDDLLNINEAELQELLQKYLERFSSIAGSMIYCGSILNWLEMDNRGNRLLAVDDSGINTPAIAAAHAIRRYNAQAADEISLEIGDIVSVIDKPPPEDTMWWRGKRGFEVGFFPGECVELIGDKVPQSMASRIPPPSRKPSSGPVKRGSTWNEGASGSAATPNPSSDTVLRKHSKLISFLQRFFFTRPARNQLKRSGIVKERVFGCDLGEHLLNSGHDVPLVLKCCAEVIEKHGIVDGIYRLSGINSNIQKLRHAFDEDRVPNLADETYLQDIHSISSLLKMYFRELPNPLLTYQLYDKFAKAVQDEDKLHLIHDVVQQLPPPHYRTTEYLIRHLARVAGHGRDTGMHSKNLAIVWAPNLLRSKELELGGGVAALQGVSIQAVVTEFLICYADLIFSDKMPSYSSPELRQSQKKPRPKSLAISTPTRLLTLEEARERALSSHNVPAQKYIDVGGGPEKLPPKYHTVLDLPGYKKKTREPGSMTTLVKPKKSPVSGWKSFFSKSRSSSVKQKARKSSLQGLIYDTDGAGSVSTMERKAITEEDVHNWKKRRLRSAKSAESLLSLSSHKNSISSASSSARNSRGLIESDLVVNLYSGDDRSRVRQHKRSLSSDASTVLLHHEVLPLHDRTNSDITHSAVAVDFNPLNRDDDDDDESSVSSDDSSDENEVPPQLNDVHGQTRQSFIRGDSTRRAIAHRKTSSAPSTPQQQNRQESSDNQMRLSHCESDEDDNSTKKNSSSDELNIFKGKLVKSVEFVEPLDLSMSFLISKSEDSLASRRGSSALEKEITYELSQLGKSEPHMSGVKHRQAYYSRVHDYAEIDESQISAPNNVLEKAKLCPCAMKEEQEEAANSNIVSKPELSKQFTSPLHSPTAIVFTPTQKIEVCKNKEIDPGLTPASNDSSPEHTTQLRSDLLSEIAKLEDSISPISYLQKEEMSKCLSVPSDIGKSLENVNLGSQSDLMSGVSISELSQSIDSISVNDSMDLDLSTITGNYSDSKTLNICKEINKAFSSCNTKMFETQEKGRSTSDLRSSYQEPKQGEYDLKNSKLKQGRSSLNEKSSNYANTKIEAMKKSLVGQECQPSHLSSSVSDNCVRRENKAKMEPAKRYSHHIIDKPKPESANPLFIVESPPSFTSLDNFTQMLQFYAPAEVQHMMSESSDYWNRKTSGRSTNSALEDEGNGGQSKPHISHQLSPSSVCKYHNELSPLDIDFTQFGSKEPTPVSSPSTVCKSPNLWPLSDIDILDDSNKNVWKRKSDTFGHKSSSSSSLDGIPQKSLSLADTGEDNMMVRSLPAGTSITDPIAELNFLTSSDSNSSKNRTCSEGSLLPCKTQSISQTQKQYPFSTQMTNSSPPPLSLRRWESMEVPPSLDSTMVFSPSAVISTSHSDSEFLTLGLTPDQNHSMLQSERDSCETLISSPSSPFSSKNYQILYGTLQSCAARPMQSCIPDLDNIMNMSREEISNAEKLILSEEEKARLQQTVGDCSKKVPLASPEISTVSDQSDVCSDKKQTDSMSESRSREKLIQNQTSLKKSRTDSALGQSRQKAPPRSELSDSQLTSKKSANVPKSPTKSSSEKDGIDKLQRSFITDCLESAVGRIPESVAKEPQLMPEKQGVTSANKEKKLPDSKKYYSSPVISEVLTGNQNKSYNWTGTKSKSFPVSQLNSDQYQISPPEDDVLIQIRPTLKRPVSPRRRLIEKMKQDAQRREAAQKDMVEPSSGEKAPSLSVPSLATDENSKQANNLAKVRQSSELQTQAEGTNDSLKARSLDSLLTQLKPKSGDQEKSLKEKDTFDWVMSSGSSDIPKANSKASSVAATSSDMDVVQDMEMTDNVFTDDAAVDLRNSKKQSKAGQKCASNICQSVKDTTNNRSSLDESILQVAAERHNAYEGFGKNPNGTQQYDTGSLRHPKARKLQNLKEFFEHEELKNRPGYARPLTSSTSSQNSPNCPKYQRYSSKEEEKKEAAKQPVSSPSHILRNTHHRSRSRERKDTKQGGYCKDSPSTHSRSPTPSGRKPAALEKWQRAESHERDGKQTWEMGVDYVQGKSLKSDLSTALAAATKPPPHSGSSRTRTWSESSASDADIKSPPSQRAKDERRKRSTSAEYFKSVRPVDQSAKSDTSDSEGKLSFLEMEIIGEEQLPGHKRRGSIKDLRNYFEAKQVCGEEKKISCSASSADTTSASTYTINNSNLMTLSCTSLSTESTQTSSPRQVPRSRVKSLSPVCGQSELKSDSDLAHKGSSRFSLDFSSYTSRPHVEGIVRPQPVRLGPKPFYGAKT